MELRYRVLPPASEPDPGPSVDLSLDLGPGATIGDLARAAAQVMPAEASGTLRRAPLTLQVPGQRPLDPDTAAHITAPPSGSTIRVVPTDRGVAVPPLRSPVSLVAADGRRHTLLHGTNVIGWSDGAQVQLTRAAGIPERTTIEVAERVTVRSTGSIGRLEVDGDTVLGAAVIEHGSLVRVGDHVFVARIDGPIRAAAAAPFMLDDGDRLAWPAPRHVADDGPPVEFPAPPTPVRRPGLPVLSAAVPLLMGVAVWVATRNAAVAAFVLFSVVFIVASALESRRESRLEERFRIDEFHTAVVGSAALLHRRVRSLGERGRAAHPPPVELCRRRHDDHPRLWERSPDRPRDLTVRVGTFRGIADVPVRVPGAGPSALRNRIDAAVRAARAGEFVASVDLAETGSVAVIGHGATAAAIARGIVAQVAHGIGPDRLHIAVLAGPTAAPAWAWVDWLPHTIRGDRLGDGPALVVVDGSDATCRELARRHTGQRPDDLVLWTAIDRVGVPSDVGAVIEVSSGPSDGTAELRTPMHPPLTISADHLDLADVDAFARWLCRRRPTALIASDHPRPTLRDVLQRPNCIDDPDVLLGVWRDAPPQPSAPLGVGGGGVVVVDLQRDGPHAVVAGTTGAGKSELLRTLLASLALHHPPSRINLLLIDYKGGTAFAELDALPHSVGLVTDLDGGLADRVVQSLQAELRRRELLERAGAPPEPALIVAVDEFATLTREVPGFIEGVVDVAQRGRSLGIHLVLATQRPAGVVTDAIRANTSLRICLRVADDEDSRDVLGVVDAAQLDRDQPGRALLRTARPGLIDVQIAWSGAPAAGERSRARVRPLHGGPAGVTTVRDHAVVERTESDPAAPSELAVAVRTATAAARRLGATAARRPWCPPLPARVSIDRVTAAAPPADTTTRTASTVIIGLVDRPEAQRIDPLVIDLQRRGGVVVSGAGGSGRSTALRTLATEFARGATHHRVHAIDGGGALDDLRSIGADVVDLVDVERTLRLLRSLVERVDAPEAPDTLLLVDGWAPLCEHHERINRGEAVELLARIAVNARRSGVHVALSTTTAVEVTAPVMASLGHHLMLRCASVDDTFAAGLPAHLGDPRTPPGRGWFDGHLVQIATPRDRRGATVCGYATPSLPSIIPLDELDGGTIWCWPVGRRADDLGDATVDLTAGHLLVLGPPRSGRSTALRTCAAQARRAGPGTVVAEIDGRDPDRERAAATVRAVLDLAAERPHHGAPDVLLVIDDLCDLLDDDVELDQRLAAVLRRPGRIRVVASADIDGVARSFADTPRLLRVGRRGVLLQPDPDLHPPLLHATVSRRDDLPSVPGRGWIVADGPPVVIQFAMPRSGTS